MPNGAPNFNLPGGDTVHLTVDEARTALEAVRGFIHSKLTDAGNSAAPEFYLLQARLEEYLNETYETFNDDYGG